MRARSAAGTVALVSSPRDGGPVSITTPRSRTCRRLALTAAALCTLLVGVGVGPLQAQAQPTLTLSPTQGQRGSTFTATYAWHQDCPNDFMVRFFWDSYNSQIGFKTATEKDCSATVQLRVPTAATCARHTVYARVDDSGGGPQADSEATSSFTVVCPQPTPTRTPTRTPTPIPTRTPTRPPSPTPTARPTPGVTSGTPTPTRSALPTTAPPSQNPSATPSASPSRSATPVPVATPSSSVVTVPPPDGGSSGRSQLPWAVGGGLLALTGIAAALGVMAPRGAPKPIVGAVVVVSLLGGAALAVVPDLRAAEPSLVGATYTTLSTSDGGTPAERCRASDLPLNGGFEGFEVRPVLTRFQPADQRVWRADIRGVPAFDEEGAVDPRGVSTPGGNGATVCLTLHEDLAWQLRAAVESVHPGTGLGSAGCQPGETVVTGGWRLPWGHSGFVGAFPETRERWSVRAAIARPENRGLPGDAYALCARFPSRVRVYHATGSASGGAAAIARCEPGDGVLNGGGYAYPIAGSHPVDGGWAVEAQPGGTASAFAICYDPGRKFGLHASYTRSATGTGHVTATCDPGDSILAGGWTNGHGLDTFQHFLPDGAGWRLKVSLSVGGAASSYALCAKPYAP